ncbi:hypothetical protein AKO1_009870 [Acrasis kona]|uniref:STAS domain-containing protein n=1 Tax=Acrasis kona TaxID=1008807 RepID=A0AAW2ZRQ6_9EUKA
MMNEGGNAGLEDTSTDRDYQLQVTEFFSSLRDMLKSKLHTASVGSSNSSSAHSRTYSNHDDLHSVEILERFQNFYDELNAKLRTHLSESLSNEARKLVVHEAKMCIYHNYLEILLEIGHKEATDRMNSDVMTDDQQSVKIDVDQENNSVELTLHDLSEQASLIRSNFSSGGHFEWNLSKRRINSPTNQIPSMHNTNEDLVSPGNEEGEEFKVHNMLFRNKKALVNIPLWKRILLFFAQFLPIVTWLPEYFKKENFLPNIKSDLIAGITVAIVIIPQSMGYALVAGMPPINGLYTCFIPTLLYPFFGTSKQLAPGPSAIVSLLLSSAISGLGPQTTEQYVNYAILLCLLAGGAYFVLGFFRMGFLVNFMSQPVLSGFTSACAISIAMTQIKYCLGVHPEKTSGTQLYWALWVYGKAIFTPTWKGNDMGIHWPTAASSVVFFALLYFFNDCYIPLGKGRRFYPGKIIPGQLVVVCFALFAFYLLGLIAGQHGPKDVFGIEILGSIKTGLPTPGVPKFYTFVVNSTLSQLNGTLAPGQATATPIGRMLNNEAEPSSQSDVLVGYYVGDGIIDSNKLLACALITITVVIVGFSEAFSVAKFYATQKNYRIDANQEMIALGICAIAAGFFQAYPSSTSFSRSAVNAQVGAATQMATFITGLFMFLVLTVITPLFYYLPKPFLGSLIIIAVSHLLDWHTVKVTWRTKRRDTLLLAVAFLSTLFLGVEWGIVVAVFISLALVIYRTARPRFNEMGRMPGSIDYSSVKRFPRAITLPHVLVMRFDSDLSFTNVSYFMEKIERYLERAENNGNDVFVFVLDMTGVNQIDSSGVAALISVKELLDKKGVNFYFAETKVEILRIMQRGGVISDRCVPETHMYHSLHDAVLQAKHDVKDAVQRKITQDGRNLQLVDDKILASNVGGSVVVDDDFMNGSRN